MFFTFIINTLITGSGYALVAMAFRLIYSVSPFFNFTIGSLMALAAYTLYYLSQSLGLNPFFTVPITMAITALAAFLLEIGVYRPLTKKGASPMILLVVSLGIYTIFEAIIQLSFGAQYKTIGSITDNNMIDFASVHIPVVQFLSIISSFAVFAGLYVFLHKTFLGKQIRAIHDSWSLAHILGLKNNHIVIMVSLLAGAVLGLAGVLTAYDVGLEPTMGFNLLFKGIIGAIIGGMASISGAFFGAFFLAFAENIGVYFFASEWRDLIAFTLFIFFLYLRPQGIFSKKEPL